GELEGALSEPGEGASRAPGDIEIPTGPKDAPDAGELEGALSEPGEGASRAPGDIEIPTGTKDAPDAGELEGALSEPGDATSARNHEGDLTESSKTPQVVIKYEIAQKVSSDSSQSECEDDQRFGASDDEFDAGFSKMAGGFSDDNAPGDRALGLGHTEVREKFQQPVHEHEPRQNGPSAFDARLSQETANDLVERCSDDAGRKGDDAELSGNLQGRTRDESPNTDAGELEGALSEPGDATSARNHEGDLTESSRTPEVVIKYEVAQKVSSDSSQSECDDDKRSGASDDEFDGWD
ncbi:hypothetical protein CYMTET_20780, partial [Cymbomonas tetramitiformis]